MAIPQRLCRSSIWGSVVNCVYPVIQVIQFVTGLAPNATQLQNWVGYLEGGGSLASVAAAFAAGTTFSNDFAGGATIDPNVPLEDLPAATANLIMTNIITAALGTAPSPSHVAGWIATGLSTAQILAEFALGDQWQAKILTLVQNYLTGIAEAAIGTPGAVFPSGSLFGLPLAVVPETYTFTLNQDTLVGSGGGADTFNAPLVANAFGFGLPTLTKGDSATDAGTGNVLNATFNGFDDVTALNLVGIQTWNIQQTGLGTISLTNSGPGNNLQGITALNYNGNGFGSSLIVGTTAFPIIPATDGTFNDFSLSVANTPGFKADGVDVSMSKTGFTGTDTILVTATNVGATANGVPYQIAAGSPTIGFQAWHINSQGGGGITNNIALGGDGSTTAKFIVVTDDGVGDTNTTLYAAHISGSSAADFANVTDINLSATSGFVTITGAEWGLSGGPGGFSDGLLTDNNSIKTIEGGTGNSLYDLTSLTPTTVNAAGFAIDGGHSTAGDSAVEFNNAVITGATHLIDLTNIQVLDDLSDVQGGTINMAFWAQQGSPGSGPGLTPLNTPFTLAAGGTAPAGFQLLQFLNSESGPDTTLTSNLVIENGPTNFAVNMQDTAGGPSGVGSPSYDITISQGPLIDTASMLDVWVSDEGSAPNGALGATALNIPQFTINDYTTVNIFLPTEGGHNVFLGSTVGPTGGSGFIDQPVVSVTDATLTFNDNTADTGGTPGPDNLFLGHIDFPGFDSVGTRRRRGADRSVGCDRTHRDHRSWARSFRHRGE